MLEFDIIKKKGERMLSWLNPAFSLFKAQAQRLLNDLNETKKFQEEYKANRERQQKQYELIMQQRKQNETKENV